MNTESIYILDEKDGKIYKQNNNLQNDTYIVVDEVYPKKVPGLTKLESWKSGKYECQLDSEVDFSSYSDIKEIIKEFKKEYPECFI